MAGERDDGLSLSLSLSLGGLPTAAAASNKSKNRTSASTSASAFLELNLLPAGAGHRRAPSRNPLLHPSSESSFNGGGGKEVFCDNGGEGFELLPVDEGDRALRVYNPHFALLRQEPGRRRRRGRRRQGGAGGRERGVVAQQHGVDERQRREEGREGGGRRGRRERRRREDVLVEGQRRRGRRRVRRHRRRGGRRRGGGEEEAAAVEGPGDGPGGDVREAQHAEPEAEASLGGAAEPPAQASGGLVPEQARQDEAEADGGGLRVLEAVLREAEHGEPEAAEGGAGAAGPQALPAALHEHEPSHHPHHVPVLRARGRPVLSLSLGRLRAAAVGGDDQPVGRAPDPPAPR